MFVDLKAAFDMVDRSMLDRSMRKKGIRKGLVVRVEKALRETRSKVRIGEDTGLEKKTRIKCVKDENNEV